MKYKQLNSEQRYAISLLLRQGKENKEIAEAIGVNQSTVWRERHRNSLKRGGYSSDFAQELAEERKCRQPGNRAVPESIKRRAVRLLSEKQWSPQQISDLQTMISSPKSLGSLSFSLILILPGKRGPLKMPTNLSDNISLKILSFLLWTMILSRLCNLKSMIDPEPN
jgi:hypothetical protein